MSDLSAKCGQCGHVWTVAKLPMPLGQVAKLAMQASCPMGCNGQVFVAKTPDPEQEQPQ